MKKRLLQYVLFVSVASLFAACDDNDDLWLSAAKLEMISDFSVQGEGDTVSVDFSKGETVTFNGEWNKETNWKIVIVGSESNQTDTLTGCSKSLDGVSWNGSASKKEKYFPSSVFRKSFAIDLFGKAQSLDDSKFVEGETCTVMLQFDDYEGVDTSKVVVKLASAAEEKYTKSDFCIVGDWESESTKPLYTNNGSSSKITTEKIGLTIPEGKAYCMLQGTEKGGGWYIDGMGFTYANTSGWSQPNGVYPITLADTATTYINFFMYGFKGYCDRTSLFISLIYSDESTDTEIECDLQGDRISVDEGWHGISIPVSQFQSKNAKFDYNKINKMTVVLFSNGEAGDVKTAIDFLVITKKAPLFPIYKN